MTIMGKVYDNNGKSILQQWDKYMSIMGKVYDNNEKSIRQQWE